MTEETNIIDSTIQEVDATKPEESPVDESTPDNSTLKLDTIFGEMYGSLKDSVQSFIANLSIAGMNVEHSIVHAYQHAKMLVEDYHRTPLNAAQKSVLTAQLLKDATNPQIPIEPPVVNANPIQAPSQE